MILFSVVIVCAVTLELCALEVEGREVSATASLEVPKLLNICDPGMVIQ